MEHEAPAVPYKYTPTPEEFARLSTDYTYHAPQADQPARYEALRDSGRSLAYRILTCCPPSRERSVALTQLDAVIMAANASIARNE